MGSAIGNIFGVIGEQNAMSAEIAALKMNQEWYAEQAEFARQSTRRELRIHDRESAEFSGNQRSAIARGGLGFAGSPLLVLAMTKMQQYEEREAIKAQGDIQYKEASLKGQIAGNQAKATKDAKKWAAISGSVGIFSSAMTMGFDNSRGQQKKRRGD